jgi:hypothetical protein
MNYRIGQIVKLKTMEQILRTIPNAEYKDGIILLKDFTIFEKMLKFLGTESIVTERYFFAPYEAVYFLKIGFYWTSNCFYDPLEDMLNLI